MASALLSQSAPVATVARLRTASRANRVDSAASFTPVARVHEIRGLTAVSRRQWRPRGASIRAAAAEGKAAEGAAAAAAFDESQLSGEDEQDLKDVADILETIELLKERRFMTIQEMRLTLLIEDPREAERRRQMGIENESGCSRDEIAAAFVEVCEDRVPGDRMSLRKLAQEMRDWPRLRDAIYAEEAVAAKGPSPYATITDVGLQGGAKANRPVGAAGAAGASGASAWDDAVDKAAKAAKEEAEQEKDLGNKLPPFVGYIFLYGLSVVPVLIVIAVVIILFLNSLQ
eukprot:TRINITY_DN10952_c0_g1_i1.p1 TRINITY_DN10952_c0_g1~~TRINITY_DN10952_c0_g1_i1.p1  ORF type:complete len:312 (+),score=20.60 TRINITY_DN10952_c0_g1_i1:74-937(+)